MRYEVGDTLMRPVPGLTKYNVRCLARLRTGVLMAGTTEGVIRSLDSGKSWTLIRSETTSQKEVVYVHVTDADTVVFGFCDESQTTQRLHISGDSGKTWRRSGSIGMSGPILWYRDAVCQLFDGRASASFQLGRRVVRVDYLFNPVSRLTACTADTSRYMAYCRLTTAVAFDEKHTLMAGINRTIYRSTDGGRSFRLRSHLADPGPLAGANFAMTSTYKDSVVSWAGPKQMYSTSTDAGVTWMPRKYPVKWRIEPGGHTSNYQLLSPTCFIGASELMRMDISTDGGETFEHPGIYDSTGYVESADPSWTDILSVDSIVRVAGYELYLVTDSCRQWTKKGRLPVYLYSRDSIIYSNDFVGMASAHGNVIVLIDAMKYDERLKRWFFGQYMLLRSKDFFSNTDTILSVSSLKAGSVGLRLYGDSTIVFSRNSTYYISRDLGTTWDTMDVSTVPREVWFRIPADSVYVFGQRNNIMITCDSGRTWTSVPPPSGRPDFSWDVVGYSKRRAFVSTNIRDLTSLYRIDFTPDSGVVQSVDAEPAPPPPPVHVRAVIPNPFSALVRFIVGTEPSVDTRSLSVGVYSLNGALVADLTESYRSQTPDDRGEVTIQWDATEQPQGVYRVIVQSAQGSQSVSIVKAR